MAPVRFAVIGGGISGLTAAYLLSQRFEVTLFEANKQIGGHTHTVDVTTDSGTRAIDMGFIVFNNQNYPNFVRLIDKLGISSQLSDMSFSVCCEKTGLEYSASNLRGFFAQRRNLLNPSMYRLLLDIGRFKKHSRGLLEITKYDISTLEDYVRSCGYSNQFLEQFLIPLASSIWSADPLSMRSFPISYLVRFFNHHGFLNLYGAPRWRTIKGGSSAYLGPLTRPYSERIRLSSPVSSVRRFSECVEICSNGVKENFDHVFIATHSDQALAMLADPTPVECEVLGEIPYLANETALHTDARLLPSNRRAWASWNYTIASPECRGANVTYYSNRLQSLDDSTNYCVTLNRSNEIRPETLVKQMCFEHPIYNFSGIGVQSRFKELSGKNHTSYCGAYWGFGFHEDGVKSAVEATEPFGVRL